MERYDDVSFSKFDLLPRPILLPLRIGSDWRISVLTWLIARHPSSRPPIPQTGRQLIPAAGVFHVQ
jgi:hypothetical protein